MNAAASPPLQPLRRHHRLRVALTLRDLSCGQQALRKCFVYECSLDEYMQRSFIYVKHGRAHARCTALEHEQNRRRARARHLGCVRESTNRSHRYFVSLFAFLTFIHADVRNEATLDQAQCSTSLMLMLIGLQRGYQIWSLNVRTIDFNFK